MDCDFIDDEYMNDVYERISQLFRNERHKKNLSIAIMERKSGIDKTAIYKMEKNKRRFGFENLIKMCYVLNLKLDDLYYVEDDDKNDDKYRQKIHTLINEISEDNCRQVYNFILKLNN